MNTLTVRAEITLAEADTTQTGLNLPDNLRFNEWRDIGELLEQHHNRSLWWIADWAAYGDRQYRREYGAGLERIYTRGSLRNLASIANRVEPSRRRDNLSFSHHGEIAQLDADYQNAFLDDAFEKSWTVLELREQVAAFKNQGHRPSTPALALRIASVDDRYELFTRAAATAGKDFNQWAYDVLEQAARLQLEQPVTA
jgi:hypothetical protein